MTPKQKLLKTKLLSFLDKLIAHVEELKDTGVPTSLDSVLKQQRQRVASAETPTVLLQVSESDVLAKYLARIDDLEDSAVDDGDLDPHDSQVIERKCTALESWLESHSEEMDSAREAVEKESGDFATAGASEAFQLLSDSLRAQGATTALVIAFQRKTMSELVQQRKYQRRWRKTPEGKRALQKAERRAKRPHIIDRTRSKAQKLARKAYTHY